MLFMIGIFMTSNFQIKMIMRNPFSWKQKKEEVFSSKKYWENRYAAGGNSGEGSYDKLAKFKADFLNKFITTNHINRVVEFGCGDGNQLSLANYPEYIGLDVSSTIIQKIANNFLGDETKSFFLYNADCFQDNLGVVSGDLTLSLDVIYHLIEDDVYQSYMLHLFNSSNKYVIIYSTDFDQLSSQHVKHRKFSDWISKNRKMWKLSEQADNQHPRLSKAKFFVFERIDEKISGN